jgi:hypothetical protein
MLWKIYFIARAENGIAKSNHYKVENGSPTRALYEALTYVESHYKVRLIEIEDCSVKKVTQEEWDAEDGYEVLH